MIVQLAPNRNSPGGRRGCYGCGFRGLAPLVILLLLLGRWWRPVRKLGRHSRHQRPEPTDLAIHFLHRRGGRRVVRATAWLLRPDRAAIRATKATLDEWLVVVALHRDDVAGSHTVPANSAVHRLLDGYGCAHLASPSSPPPPRSHPPPWRAVRARYSSNWLWLTL